MKRIGLLGCGAIGTQIAMAIDSGKIPAQLTHIYDDDKSRASILHEKLSTKPEIVENSHLLSSNPVDLVVEAASQDAVRDDALSILQNKKDLMVMSVGALLDEAIFDVLYDACQHFGKTIYLPSGAIAGLDAIKAVKDELDSVTLTTTKHPKSLSGAPFFSNSEVSVEGISEKMTLFEGTPAEAVGLFPKNINVSALLSLAGLGSEKTRVKIVADSHTDKNTHQIEAVGSFGRIFVTIENNPDPTNPKTSRLAMLSAIEMLKEICSDGIRIGT